MANEWTFLYSELGTDGILVQSPSRASVAKSRCRAIVLALAL